MKVIRHLFNYTIWIIVGLYLTVALAFRIPSVQWHVGWRVSNFLSEKLGTNVRVGHVNPGFLNRLVVDRIRILDQQGEEMLTANRVGVRIDLLSLLFQGNISISTAQVFGAKANFYQTTPAGPPNFQFALDSLASKDDTDKTPLDLRINSLIMRHTSIRYDKRYEPETPGKLNLSHLNLQNLNTYIVLKHLTPDTLNVSIKKMSFREHSGLKVDRLSLLFEGGRHESHLRHLQVKMPGTDINLDNVSAYYQMEGDSILLSSLRYQGEIAPSRITLSDIASLQPSLNTFNSTLSIASRFQGQGADIEVPVLDISSSTGDIGLETDGWVKNIDTTPVWYADIRDLSLSAKTINFISENLQGEHIDVPPILVRLGDIHLRGAANGTALSEVHSHQQLSTGAGDMSLTFHLEKGSQFSCDLNTEGINLRQLLDDDKFGHIATAINLKGSLANKFHVTAEGIVSKLEYNNYNYQNIKVNGTYADNDLSGNLMIDDPNIGLEAEGLYKRDGRTHDIKLEATILNLSPKAINLSDQWDDAKFYADVSANLTGSSLSDMRGYFDLSNFAMVSPTDRYELDQLHMETGFEEQIHYINVKSDFAEATIRGAFDYETLSKSFTNFIASQMPTLPGIPQVNPDTRNNFVLNATISRSDWMQQVLGIPFVIQQPVSIYGFINDNTQDINLECALPSFTYNGTAYRNGNIRILSPNDSLHFQMGVTKIMDNGTNFDVHTYAYAHDNNLSTHLIWDNHEKAERHISGTLHAVANFYQNVDGKESAYVSVEPSDINIHDTHWTVEPCEITYTNKLLTVNDFTIRHDEQHISVNGIASERDDDALNVTLHGIDIEYILELVNFDAVSFSGRATGMAQAKGVFSDQLQASAQLMVDHFKFQQGSIGMLNANVEWDNSLQQINIHAIADDGQFPDGRKSKTYVDGYVSLLDESIDLAIRAQGTRVEFMKSFTESFISHIDGYALGNVRLAGPLSTINLTGELVVNGEAHVKPTGCTYQLRNDTIRMRPDEIEFTHCPIYDVNGRQGMMSGGIHHKHLTNLTFDILVRAENLLAYDFADFGEDTFYGTVYGTGNVSIHGLRNETVIDVNVTPQPGSVIVYNVASPTAIASQEFIEWGVAGEKTDSSVVAVKQAAVTHHEQTASDLHINFHINCNHDATIRLLMDSRTNDYITLRGNGVIRANYFNKGGFQMYGLYTVEEGTYNITIQDIIKKDFTFQPGGTITFSGDPYDANLNLQAQHTVNGVSLSDLNVGKSFSNTVRVNCLMNITGQPSQPVIDFDLDLPNVNSDEKQMVRSIINSQDEMNQQVLYLLGIGRFYPQGANNATAEDATERSRTSLAMQSLLSGTLSSQINSLLRTVVKSNDWSIGANISTGDEGWNNAEYEGTISGRMFNNRLLVNGQFGYRDKANTATTSFIGDFDIRYLLLPNGNFALKVYNQTNDRYFTKSSLNTQGIGIIMKKDFSSWRDLLGKKKKKKAKKK